MSGQSLKDILVNDRPRERMLYAGIAALSDAELLAVVLRSGGKDMSALLLASLLLSEFDGFIGLLNADIYQLIKYKNIGFAKATCIKAACAIGIRINTTPATSKIPQIRIDKPSDVYRYIKPFILGKKKEMLYVLSLNARNMLISSDIVSVGNLTETIVDPREVFKIALIKNANSIILVHNHPSGDASPSPQDLYVTDKLVKAGNNISILVLDHIVVSDTSYMSIKNIDSKNIYKFTKKGGENEKH